MDPFIDCICDIVHPWKASFSATKMRFPRERAGRSRDGATQTTLSALAFPSGIVGVNACAKKILLFVIGTAEGRPHVLLSQALAPAPHMPAAMKVTKVTMLAAFGNKCVMLCLRTLMKASPFDGRPGTQTVNAAA
jgi:hypothetical protein